MPALKLVRSGAPPVVLRDLEADTTFLTLGKLIESSFGFRFFTLTAGFPPKQIDFVPEQRVFGIVPHSSAIHVNDAPAPPPGTDPVQTPGTEDAAGGLAARHPSAGVDPGNQAPRDLHYLAGALPSGLLFFFLAYPGWV